MSLCFTILPTLLILNIQINQNCIAPSPAVGSSQDSCERGTGGAWYSSEIVNDQKYYWIIKGQVQLYWKKFVIFLLTNCEPFYFTVYVNDTCIKKSRLHSRIQCTASPSGEFICTAKGGMMFLKLGSIMSEEAAGDAAAPSKTWPENTNFVFLSVPSNISPKLFTYCITKTNPLHWLNTTRHLERQ